MAGDSKEHVDHEAVLTGVIALANLFSNCVEAFGLIHPQHRFEKEEQLLLCRLGLQQARLLIWGDVVGISSPPSSVTDRAVPKHPSAAYPDLKEPTFFGARDATLDETEKRKEIESALSAIVDRASSATRDEMMHKYGLKPPKKFASEYQPALDTNRLEAFRERYELLKEVCESYAHINTRRSASITQNNWVIADFAKFNGFIKLAQEKVDFLVNMTDVKERIDRAMRMDIKALGWHLSADRARIAMDVSKLRLIQEASRNEYPEYLDATQHALDNIERERRENVITYNPYASQLASPMSTPHHDYNTARRGSTPLVHAHAHSNETNGNASAGKGKRPGLFGRIFGKSQQHIDKGRSQSVAVQGTGSANDDPERSLSDTGPLRPGSHDSMEPIEPVRSKSVGAILERPTEHLQNKSVEEILAQPAETEDEIMLKHKLEHATLTQIDTNQTVPDEQMDPQVLLSGQISAHDQYHGLGRQQTHTQYTD